MSLELLIQFVFAFAATCGLSIIFRVPVSKIPVCGLTGAFGWVIYQLASEQGFSAAVACFAASCIVALLSDIFSKTLKEAATIFIIPGIMCLVPGSGMYRAMLSLLHNDIASFTAIGVETLLAAGAIAAGLLVMGSLLRLLRTIAKVLRN